MPHRSLPTLAIAIVACSQIFLGQTTKNSPPVERKAATAKPAPSRASTTIAPRPLALTKTVALDTPPQTAFTGLPQCDGDGNFYVSDGGDGLSISKFNPQGERTALFRASSSPDVAQVDAAGAFTVTAGGDVYQLVFPHSYDRDVFLYNKDGSYKSKVKLDAGGVWSPNLFVVLPSGDFLAAGQKWDRSTQENLPFTGIFSSNGTLLKQLQLEDDEHIHQLAGACDSLLPGSRCSLNFAISRGQMELAPDGNVYLLRWLNPAVIYAISPGGEVVRRFTVNPGDQELTVGGMVIAGNRIAVLFRKSSANHHVEQQLIQVIDLEGHEVATYEQPMAGGNVAFGVTLSCYSQNPEQFTLLGWTEGDKMVLNIVEPR